MGWPPGCVHERQLVRVAYFAHFWEDCSAPPTPRAIQPIPARALLACKLRPALMGYTLGYSKRTRRLGLTFWRVKRRPCPSTNPPHSVLQAASGQQTCQSNDMTGSLLLLLTHLPHGASLGGRDPVYQTQSGPLK